MKAFALFCGILFSGSWASAFINIESLRQGIDQGFSGSSGASLDGSTGNVEVQNVGVNSQNIFQNEKRQYIFITEYSYGEAQNKKNTNEGSFHLRFAQAFSNSLWWEIFGQAEFNEFQSLSLRSLGGAGLRAALFETKQNSIYLGLGAFYEDEEIKNDQDQANFRGNLYLSLRSLFNDNAEGVLILYYQPSAKTVDDYRLRATAGLETKIMKFLSLVNSVSLAHDSRPPGSIEQEDITYQVMFNFTY